MIILWHFIFTPGIISWEGDYIVTWNSHPWQYLVRGWLYCDITFSLLAIFGQGGGLYRDIIFSLLGNIWWGGDYILTHFHSWKYFVRRWLYRDIIFSLLIIFGEGVITSWHYNIISDTTLDSGTRGDYIWIFSLSKFYSAVIPGFYYSYPYSPHETWGLKWLYLNMIPPSLLLKLSVLMHMLMDCINSLWWTKICKKS